MEVRSLNDIGIDEVFAAWEDAFGDYEVKRSKAELEVMLVRRGYVPHLSFGAFDGARLVSFTLNGIGLWNGVKTAYDSGTGTIKAYRSKGLATRIFTESVPVLKNEGVQQYLLEVLQHNKTAVQIYTRIGFRVSREFNYFITSAQNVRLNEGELPRKFRLSEINLSHRAEMAVMWDFPPSWQNSFDAISRCPESFKVVGAFDGDRLAGYGILEPATGDIPQLAVSKLHRRQGIGAGILQELLRYNQASVIKVINTETGCAELTKFLEGKGIQKTGMQFEMVKVI